MAAKIINIIFAIAIFFSSVGFIVNKHYCQDKLKGVALFVHASSCHKADERPTCPGSKYGCKMHQEEENEDNNCCDNEQDYLKLDQDQQIQSFEFEKLKNPVLLSTIFIVLNIELPSIDAHTLHYLTYKPPIVCDDISVLLQIFLL